MMRFDDQRACIVEDTQIRTGQTKSPKPIRTLTFTTLYPSTARPGHGIFVETRLRHLLRSEGVETRVVAPVPWFPLASPRFGAYGEYAATPYSEKRFGIDVLHPRYLLPPKAGMHVGPLSLFAFCLPRVRKLMRTGFDFDLIDAHYVYPDGVAAVLLGRAVGRPVVITARGTDINLLPNYRLPRHMIRWALRRADGIVSVCRALKDEMVHLGVAEERITVLRNGVDLELFKPIEPAVARADLGVSSPVLLIVGNLVEEKNHALALNALVSLPQATLLVVGRGREEFSLKRLAVRNGVDRRVHFLGFVPQCELSRVYSAADILILASSREGWPNVLLEAMACGVPVITTAVGGATEMVTTSQAGRLIHNATPSTLADAVQAVLADRPRRCDTRAHAERFSWDDTTRGQEALFSRILETRATNA